MSQALRHALPLLQKESTNAYFLHLKAQLTSANTHDLAQRVDTLYRFIKMEMGNNRDRTLDNRKRACESIVNNCLSIAQKQSQKYDYLLHQTLNDLKDTHPLPYLREKNQVLQQQLDRFSALFNVDLEQEIQDFRGLPGLIQQDTTTNQSAREKQAYMIEKIDEYIGQVQSLQEQVEMAKLEKEEYLARFDDVTCENACLLTELESMKERVAQRERHQLQEESDTEETQELPLRFRGYLSKIHKEQMAVETLTKGVNSLLREQEQVQRSFLKLRESHFDYSYEELQMYLLLLEDVEEFQIYVKSKHPQEYLLLQQKKNQIEQIDQKMQFDSKSLDGVFDFINNIQGELKEINDPGNVYLQMLLEENRDVQGQIQRGMQEIEEVERERQNQRSITSDKKNSEEVVQKECQLLEKLIQESNSILLDVEREIQGLEQESKEWEAASLAQKEKLNVPHPLLSSRQNLCHHCHQPVLVFVHKCPGCQNSIHKGCLNHKNCPKNK